MNNQDVWHSHDAFWELVEPVLFNEQRLSSARGEADKIEKLLQIETGARMITCVFVSPCLRDSSLIGS